MKCLKDSPKQYPVEFKSMMGITTSFMETKDKKKQEEMKIKEPRKKRALIKKQKIEKRKLIEMHK